MVKGFKDYRKRCHVKSYKAKEKNLLKKYAKGDIDEDKFEKEIPKQHRHNAKWWFW